MAALNNTRFPQRYSDAIISLGLFLFAFLVRWPKLFLVPRFRENELNVTLDLVHRKEFPLINQHAHIGALSNYIHALAFWLFGMHFWVPGAVAILAACVSVVLAYHVGKALTDRKTSLIAALLLIASVYHIYFISHVPWSNCLTPLFTLIMLLLFLRAIQKENVPLLISSAFIFGLALQTHPSVVTLAPALMILLVLNQKSLLSRWLRKPAFYLIFIALIVGYGNVLYYRILPDASKDPERMEAPEYALEENPGVDSYVHNTYNAWTLLMRLLSAQVDTKRPAYEHWQNPVFLACFVFLIAGVVFSVFRKKWALPLFLVLPMLVIPAVNKIYGFCNFGRYMGFLLPIALLLMSFALIETIGLVRKWKIAQIASVVVIMCSLMLYHFYQLSRVYAALSLRDSSAILLTMRHMLHGYDRKQTAILVDGFSWHENQMRPFLESDGWFVERLIQTDLLNLRTRNVEKVHFELLPDQLKRMESLNRRNILIIASPMIIKSLLASGYLVSFEGCLSNQKPERPNMYEVLLSGVYYVFRASSAYNSPNNAEPTLHPFFSIADWIPDDLSRGLREKNLGGSAKNPNFPRQDWHQFRDYLESQTSRIPQLPDVNHRICMPERL